LRISSSDIRLRQKAKGKRQKAALRSGGDFWHFHFAFPIKGLSSVDEVAFRADKTLIAGGSDVKAGCCWGRTHLARKASAVE
jgi:hypothetical protein